MSLHTDSGTVNDDTNLISERYERHWILTLVNLLNRKHELKSLTLVKNSFSVSLNCHLHF